MEASFQNICIVGSGFMGWQIGFHCAVNGYNVHLVDSSPEKLQKASSNCLLEIEKRYNSLSAVERNRIIERLQYTEELELGSADADLVIEAIPENPELKRNLFVKLDHLCPQKTVFATNSSSLWINSFATVRLDSVLNMHFYPMVWDRPFVELGSSTLAPEIMNKMRSFAQSIGLTPLTVLKESTGFIFNRVWRAIKKECLTILDEGVATCDDVDRAWMICFSQKIGPFGLMDMVGLDVVKDIENVYYEKSKNPSDNPPKALLDKIEKNEMGVKSKKGFYSYPNPGFSNPKFLKGDML